MLGSDDQGRGFLLQQDDYDSEEEFRAELTKCGISEADADTLVNDARATVTE